jgi:hypothetical protein
MNDAAGNCDLLGVTECWTDSGRSVALIGLPNSLQAIAGQIEVSLDYVINLYPQRAVLGLWGAELVAYRAWRHEHVD